MKINDVAGLRLHANAFLNPNCILITIIFCLLVLTCDSAFAWGSLASSPIGMSAPSHQYILRCANESLFADPAYDGSNFPKVGEILQFEGIYVNAIGNTGGEGPDKDTPYTGHDYNPRTEKGKANSTAAEFYDKLKDDLLKKNKSAAKDAAYLAHYVADVSCPFHINGMPADEAKKLKPTGRDLILDDKIQGPILPRGTGPMGGNTFILIVGYARVLGGLPSSALKRGHCGWNGTIEGANWTTELANWTDINKNKPNADWFDPWYSDGMAKEGYEEQSSTHTFWELYAFQNCSPVANSKVIKVDRYSDRFTQKGNGNKKNIDNLVKNAASETLKHQQELLDESTEGEPGKVLDKDSKLFSAYKRAIEDVYTAWRASFSALRPDITMKEAQPSTGEKIIVINITNKADSEAAKNITINLKVKGGTLKGPEDYSYPNEIKPHEEVSIADVWRFIPKEKGSCEAKINLTVNGEFKEIPDSGQAFLSKDFSCNQCNWKDSLFGPCYFALNPFKAGKEPWNDMESNEAWVEVYPANSFKCMDGEACAYFYNFPTERPCEPPKIETEDEIFVKIDKNDSLHYYDNILGKVTPSEVTYNYSWAECCGSIGNMLSCDTGWIHGSTTHTFRYTKATE